MILLRVHNLANNYYYYLKKQSFDNVTCLMKCKLSGTTIHFQVDTVAFLGGGDSFRNNKKKWFGREKKEWRRRVKEEKREQKKRKRRQLAGVNPHITDCCSKPDAQEPKPKAKLR